MTSENTQSEGFPVALARARGVDTPLDIAKIDVRRLDPQVVDPVAAKAIHALLREGESANTVRSYQSAASYWAAWFLLRYGREISLPVSVPVVLQFLVDHLLHTADGELANTLPEAIDQALVDHGYKAALGPLALATVNHRISVLSKLHQSRHQPNPCAEVQVRELVSKIKKAYAKRGVVPNKKAAITADTLQRILATCDDSLCGVRDRALLLFAWASGGRRRSEVVSATVERLDRKAAGEFHFRMGATKTNQTGRDKQDSVKPVLGEAGKALEAWLEASGITGGPIFRSINKAGRLGKPLQARAVRDIVIKRSELAGLDPKYSAHSLRSGFVTEAGLQGVPIGESMLMSGHASMSSFIGYWRQGEVDKMPGARLFDNASERTSQE